MANVCAMGQEWGSIQREGGARCTSGCDKLTFAINLW